MLGKSKQQPNDDVLPSWEELFLQLCKAEDEEEASIYLLGLHLHNEGDMKFFSNYEREIIKTRLAFLIEETMRHKKILADILQELENSKLKNEC